MGRINTFRFIEACKDSGGVISLIAKRLSCSRRAVYDFLEREPTMKLYLSEAEDQIVDMAESKLIKSMNEGNMEDVRWYLQRKGKKRGYSDKEIVSNNVQVMNVQVDEKELIDKAVREAWIKRN